MLDIVLDEVATAGIRWPRLRTSSGTPFETLSEDELRTTRHPERRYLTVSFTQLRGLGPVPIVFRPWKCASWSTPSSRRSATPSSPPAALGEASGDSVLGIYGAPAIFADHPLRAIRAVCDQMHRSAQLRPAFIVGMKGFRRALAGYGLATPWSAPWVIPPPAALPPSGTLWISPSVCPSWAAR